jgi:hypothetical protein
MSIRLTASLALIAAALGAPSIAATRATGTASTEQADAKPEKEKKVCRRVIDTGSVMPKRVCVSASQAAAEARQAELEADRRRSQSGSSIGG